MKWTHEWPTEPGWYWFYGDPHGIEKHFTRLYPVRVYKVSNGWAHIAEGNFMFPSEASDGVWIKMIVPKLPEEKT